jgi:HK97 family phage prohead protease
MSAAEPAPGTLFGTAIRYATPTTISTPVGAFVEMIAPGSIAPSVLADPQITCVREHDPALLLARVQAGSLDLIDAPWGVDCRAALPATDTGAEVAFLVSRGELTGMSFAFTVGADEWHDPLDAAGPPTRVITEISRLFDVSIVTWPAYPGTSVSLKRGAAGGRSAREMVLAAKHDRLVVVDLARRTDAVDGRPNLAGAHRSTLARPDALAQLGPVCRTLPDQARWVRRNRQVVRTGA